MILQALEQCYDIMQEDTNFDVAPFGYSKIMCSFALVINQKGELKAIYDLRDGKKGELHTVPLQAGRQGKNPPPYMLCDNSKYVLGYDYEKKSKKLISYFDRLDSSYMNHKNLLSGLCDPGAIAVLKFMEKTGNGKVWDIGPENDVYKGGFLLFKLEGEGGYIHERPVIKQAWDKYLSEQSREAKDTVRGQCLITGEDDVQLARIHTSTKGVMGANATGGTLVGFNLDSSRSYGKEQSYNAPVNEAMMFKYTTALNELLSNNSNRLVIGDTTCAFWTEKEISGNCTKVIMSFFSGEIIEDEAQIKISAYGTKQTKDVLTRILYGMNITPEMIEYEKDTKVFILGLSPNNARLAVRYWYTNTFGNFIEKIRQHYEDMEIVKSDKSKKIISTRDIINTMAVGGKTENIPKTMENALFTAITSNSSYPQGVYANIIIRIRAEAGDDWCINHIRAGFIKAYLKRKLRIKRLHDKEEELTVALNENSTSTAYHLGRLFAVLEKLQQDAGNKGLRERYFASASTNPKIVFPSILKLAQSHIAKVGKNQGGSYMDKICQEILSKIDEFPTSLSLDDQGMFILGYYHQRQYIYTKKEDK